MNVTELTTPGAVTNGQKLRNECCKALSFIQIVAVAGKTDSADTLARFFLQCASAANTYAVSPVAGIPEWNPAPTVSNGTATVEQGASANGTVTATDPNGPLAYAISQQPAEGSVTLVGNAWTYTADEDATVGTDTFKVRVTDQLGASAEGTFTITITAAE